MENILPGYLALVFFQQSDMNGKPFMGLPSINGIVFFPEFPHKNLRQKGCSYHALLSVEKALFFKLIH